MNTYYDLTAPQKAIWLMEQYYKNTNVNNVCGTFFSNEKLDFDLFKKAINIFLRNNDSFKIKLKLVSGEIKQYFSELDDINFKIVNVNNEDDLRNLEEQTASEIFDLLDSFLFKIILFKYPDNHGGFVINSHHIISDSWTNGLVANDIALIYDKLKKNENYSKNKELSYKTYLQSEIDYLQTSKFEKDKEYWENVFSTIPEIATIPSVKESSSNIDDISAKRLLLTVDNTLFNKLKVYCENNKISLYNFFMAVFAVYLGRVSNLNEFVIGTPILNRTNFKEKQTTGMFINTLPLKINLKNNETFLDNLKEIAINSMALLRHQKYSFQYILEDLRKKDSNLPKLYNVLYSYQITKMNENEESLNHTTSWTFNKTTTDDLDIHMYEWNENDSIKIAYDYQISKYDEKEIKNLHARILHIIKQVTENEGIKLKEIDIVTLDEKNKILNSFNNTVLEYPREKNLVELFKEIVSNNQNNIAVVCKNKELTYKDLNEKSNSLATALKKKGIKPGDIIGVCLEKGLDLVISIWGILKCGAVYMPMYTGYPKDRLSYMITNSNTNCVIINNSSASLLEEKNTLNLDALDLTKNIKDFNIKIDVNDLAYVIYTSGSTGKPKGVKISHNNLINFVYSFNKYYNNEISNKDNFLSSTNMAFDVSIWEIFMPLLNGSTLIFNTEEIIKDISIYCENIIKNNITALYIPPNILNEVHSILKEKNYTGISKLLVGVESITNTTLNKYIDQNPEITIVNGYGPTETTICATAFEYKKDTSDTHIVPIGKPLYNNHIYILSGNNLCPLNVPGELYVAGAGVGSGYLNNNVKTKQSFKNDLFFDGMNMYATGDLAYIGSDNNIHFIGRKDNQIKLHGYRIELNEIDYAISSHPEISKSHSIVLNNSIVNYYISNEEILGADLKQFLKDKLPFYMIPSFYIRLDKFPLTVNGKIDNKNLPAPNIKINTEYKAPKTKMEILLCDIWCKLFNKEKISITDNFFELGGDSLTAIKFQTEALQYNININYGDIFANPTIEQLAKYIDFIKKSFVKERIKKTTEKPYYCLSSAQKRIYYSCLKDKQSLIYNISGGIIFDKCLDKYKLEKCFKKIIKRHSSLRTFFKNKENEIVQIVKKNIHYKLDYIEEKTDDINLICSKYIEPFDLSKAPLFRTKLIKLKNNKELLFLDIHHIISDGTSLKILIEELFDLYNDKDLSNKDLEYKDYIIWETEQLKNDNIKELKSFWINQFKDDIPLLNMPAKNPRPNVQSFVGSNYFETLDNTTYKKILQTAKRLNITPYMLMLAIYYITLSKYTSQNDIIVGTPVIGREAPELSNLIGMFVNSLPIRIKIDNKITFEEFCNTVKNVCTKDFAHQSYPFDLLINELNYKRDISRNPLFDTMFIYQNEGYPTINNDNSNIEYFIPNNHISKFDLSLEIVPINQKYELRFEYCTKLFDENFIIRFAKHYINILNTVISKSDIKLYNIAMLSEDEKNQILYDFNSGNIDYSKDKTIIELFEEQALKKPDNISIVFENQEITYKELNEKANKYARFLQSESVNSKSIVAILLPKSQNLIALILSILKLDATYILIDPSLPKDRIEYMLEDSKASFLVTSKNTINISFEDKIIFENIESDYTNYIGSNITDIIHHNEKITILYTSGSTGKPKGIELYDIGFINIVKAHNYHMNTKKCNNFLSFSSISFDMFQVELFVPLLNGSKIILTNDEEQRNPILLTDLIIKYDINFILSTPSKISLIFEQENISFPNLKVIQLGGEKLSSNIISIIKKATNATIYNAYGPSEITACCTCKEITNNTITIGKPICNMGVLILDSNNNLVPVGIPGEICIYGVGLSSGYTNNESLTKKSFIKLPWFEHTLYKSGDIGYFNELGEIVYIDRKDNQIKLRGLRIELSEIKTVLLTHPDIITCHIIVKNNEYLSAFIVSNKKLNTRDIRTFLQNKLPLYMIPRYITQIESMPINQNGKIDIKKLDTLHESNISNDYIAPRTAKEKIFCKIWESLLKTKVGIYDDIFELGADSLLAIKFKTMLIKYNINISYSDIFKYPKIHDLCKEIKEITNIDDISNYNYTEINKILSKNNIKDSRIFFTNTHNNLLLLGSNGFVGMHIIDSFLKTDSGKIYCLVRNKKNINAKKRFIDTLHFYFGNRLDCYIDKRIFILEGDVLKSNFDLSEKKLKEVVENVDTIINSAAIVKHYGKEKDFNNINIGSVENIIKFCTNNKIRLIHISSLSVSGNDTLEESHNISDFSCIFSEKDLYLGQQINNLYVKSKFLSERLVLQNVVENNLQAQIYRLGNITSRYSDGKFQIIPNDNAFVNKLRSIINLKHAPNSLLDSYVEFTPVDYCADAIIKLMQNHFENSTIYHIYNYHHIFMNELISTLNDIGVTIKTINNTSFNRLINKKINENPDLVNGIINDFNNKKLTYKSNINITSNYSLICLKLTGFSWPLINKEYLSKYIKYLKDINFF